MGYNPTAYYSSRGAEYGQTGAAGRAAGIEDVLKEKAAAKKVTQAATDKLKKKGSRISVWQGLGNIAKAVSKAAIMAGKKSFIANPLYGTLLTMAFKGAPALFEKLGVKGFKEVESPEYSKKYDVYEPYEEGFEDAKSSIRSELGLGHLLGEGGSTLLDLYMTEQSKKLFDKFGGSGKEDVKKIIDPEGYQFTGSSLNQQDIARESIQSAFGAKDTTQLYDILAGQTDLDFFGSEYETATGTSDWSKYYSDLFGSKMGRG